MAEELVRGDISGTSMADITVVINPFFSWCLLEEMINGNLRNNDRTVLSEGI